MTCYRLDVYVPSSHLDAVKNALFEAGAGTLGRYDRCCWQTRGQGQFRPLSGSNPFAGTPGAEESLEEWKLELICGEASLPAVIAALKSAHPYETPAFQYWAVQTD